VCSTSGRGGLHAFTDGAVWTQEFYKEHILKAHVCASRFISNGEVLIYSRLNHDIASFVMQAKDLSCKRIMTIPMELAAIRIQCGDTRTK